jgi:tetratricopeptide (TPR) repeat protein
MIDSLKRELFSIEDPAKKMDILIELTDLISVSESDRALKLANQTLSLAIENDNQKNKVIAWIQIGKIYKNKNEFRLSMEYGNKAKTLAADLDMELEFAESLILIAGNFSTLGDYERSANLSFEALAISERLGDKKGIENANSRIAYDHFMQENYNKSLEYYSNALKIAREIKDLSGISKGLNNVAIVYSSLGESENVKAYFEESIEINKAARR